MRQLLALSLLIGTASQFAPTIAFAQTSDVQANTSSSAYLQDNRGPIARSQFGLCWRSGYWDDKAAITGCDGQLVPPVMKITAPEIAVAPTALPLALPSTNQCSFSLNLSGDQTFTFGKSAMTTNAKKQIDRDVLPQLIHCGATNAIAITGYTDRLGTDHYNQQLSSQRAENVASYLKSKGIIATITTIGAGKSQPLMSCSNKLTHNKLVKCLAPNRRVSIEAR
ncbi:OmpA family protein [Glaciimonas sp. PAMC28666]|nr:OmpA family protein [Glaciimonas sp. PAMC28666]